MIVFLFYLLAMLACFTVLAGLAELYEWWLCCCGRAGVSRYCPVHGEQAEVKSLEDTRAAKGSVV